MVRFPVCQGICEEEEEEEISGHDVLEISGVFVTAGLVENRNIWTESTLRYVLPPADYDDAVYTWSYILINRLVLDVASCVV